jgi:diguanylate cyclase (GGDEF)-like protein/PAS domain S-box-containing protein
MIREPEFKKRDTAREPVRILLLEDNPDFAELLSARLRAMRSVTSRLEVVDRLSQALVKLASDNFGLIIADLNVLDSSGVDTVSALAPAASQPIMVLTADQEPALRQACLEAGAYDFLTKDQVSAASLERLVRLATIQSDIQRALRESEARIARLLDLSSEWYWEQDAQFRLTYMSSIRKTGLDMSLYLGRRRWDQPALNLSAADWARHRAQLERHEPFRDFEIERPSPDGSVWVSLSGEPVFDASGAFSGYRGIGRDVTARKRNEQQVAQLGRMYAALGAANEAVLRARSADEAFERGCEIAVEAGGFLLGVVYRLDAGTQTLKRAAASGPAALADEPEPPSLQHSATSLVAQACRSGAPAISNDRGPDATMYEVGSAAVFPLRVDGELAGAFGLQHAERNAFSPELVALLERLAANICFTLENFKREARRLDAERALRESEQRFRSLTGLSSDMYWEQDTEYRFTAVSGTGAQWFAGRDAMIGTRRWDRPYFNMTETDWAAHRAALDARQAFRNLELGRITEAGEQVWVSVSGEPVFDESGAFTGYRGVGTNITERKREERLLRLEHEINGRLAAAASAAAGMREALQAICGSEGWKCGRFFTAEGDGLRFDEASSHHVDDFAGLIERSRGLRFARGEGVVGAAWDSTAPIWVADMQRDPRVKRVLSHEPRLRSALVFAVRAADETLGVVSIASDRMREPDARMQASIAHIASLLGQFLQRKHAEEALREREARFRALTELSSDWYWQQDADFRFVSTSGASDARGGITPEAHVGLCRWELPRTEIIGQTWDDHRRVLEAREPFQDLLLRRHAESGEVRYVSVNGQPYFDAHGAFAGYYGIAKDVTNRIVAEIALRESEARFRSLTDLSADFYWETDASHRLLRTTQGGSQRAIDPPGGQIGKTRWEISSTRPDAAGWAAHRATVDAHLPFRDFEIARIDAEGVERHVSISGEPVFDAGGAFTGYRGVGKEITARKREENLLALEHEVTRCLAEAPSANAGVREVIRAVCATQGWPCGRYFAVDPDAGVLRFAEAWGQRDPKVERFLAKSREMVYHRGKGLSGIVWETGEALWVRDVSKDSRASGASGTFLDGGAFVFPVSSDGRRLGVLSFSSANARESDARLLQAARIIGSQVGQFLMRKKAEKKQRRRAEDLQRFRAAMDMSLDAIYLTERASMRFVDVNKVGCEWLGLAREELLKLGPHDVLNTPREQLEREYDAVIAEGAKGIRAESSYTSKDGRKGWAEVHRRALRSEHGWIIVTISRDITERKRAEERQAAHLRYQERVARFGQTALVKSDAAELVGKAVQSALEALGAEAVAYFEPGRGAGELVVRAVVGVVGAAPGVITGRPHDPMVQAMRAGTRLVTEGAHLPVPWARGMRSAALVPVRSDDKVRGVLCVCYKTPDAFGAEELNFIEATASVLATALQRIDSEGRLAYLAQFDPLTGLPNRTLLADRFSQMIVQAKRRNSPLAALFIDLDEFKVVNDTLGHAGGDALLKEVAVRLQSTVRTGDTVARISGDEFAIVLSDLARPEDAALIAQKVLDRLASAVEVHGNEVFVTASVGIAAFPGDGADAETLLGAADAAMYRAKQSGRNAYQFFTADINQRSRQRAQMGTELRRALERDEFALVYQPKFDLAERKPSGAEALLRWKHPERGVVSPVEFIPVLEETGLIVPVGEWVIRRACADLKGWQAAGLKVGPISVNLSARQFRQQDLDARIKELVAAAGVSPALLELEITESHLMQDPDHAIRIMRALTEAGLRIAIDDFGTGYSSLAYLTRFPLASLKIDRSFVKDMASDKADASIVRTIIEMAHSLGFTVVAEGVETEEQAAFLRALRCEQAQGYLFARPMPAAEMARFWVG